MRRITLTLFAVLFVSCCFAQDEDLFGLIPDAHKAIARKGWVIVLNGDFDMPGGDMAKRFGDSYRLGPSFFYKTEKNWFYGAKGDFIMGGDVHQDSLMINVKDKYGEYLSQDGYRIGVPTYERGYDVGLQGGKIIHIGKSKIKDNGIMLLTSAGFIQHKIDIFDKDKDVPQLRKPYLQGYDRLTNGGYVEEYVAYSYFSRDGLLNFHIGIDALFGFTKGRRGYLYDVMHADNENRKDILFGLRGGWYIPIFKRKSEELYFD